MNVEKDYNERPTDQPPRHPERDPLGDPIPSQEPIPHSDSRWPSSSLFPLPVPSRPFEGRPFESRNVRDRVNCAMRPRYTPAQDTQTLHELWQFRQYADPQLQTKCWGHVTRDCLPLDDSELQRMLKKFRKKKVPIARAFAALTSYQQRQIHLLILERASCQTYPAFHWTLQFIEVSPKNSKSSTCESMQVILERCLALGGLESERGNPEPDMPFRPRSLDIDSRYMPEDYTPQEYMPPPPPPMHRMVPPPPAAVNRPPGPFVMNDYHEPPPSFPRPTKDPIKPAISRHPRSGASQVAFLEDDDSFVDLEPVDSRYRSERRWRSGECAYERRPQVYYHSGIDDGRRGVRRFDPMAEVLEDRSHGRMEKHENFDRSKESERKKEERHKAEKAAIEQKIRKKCEAERKETLQAEEKKKKKRAAEEHAIEKQRRELESIERLARESKTKEETQLDQETHEGRHASEPRARVISFGRSNDNGKLRKRSSEDSVHDLISRWTVKEDVD